MTDTKEIIAQVRKIEIKTKHLVDGLIAGNYHSVFKGQGIEFSEIRDYRPGDDIRTIDWKVTARFNHPYIKEFIEERDLRVYFMFDFSASGSFGNLLAKKRKAIEMSSTLMFSAMRNNDNIGLLIFTKEVEKYIPAKKGRRHVLKLISALVSHEPESKETDIKNALSYAANVIKKRSIIFVISDFFDRDFITPMIILKNRHDVIAVRVNDYREYKIPDIGLIHLEDEETGEQILVDTSDQTFRKRYEKIMTKQKKLIEKSLKKHKIDTVSIVTDEPYDIPLRKFFRLRQKKVWS
ncbi:DUF58 domain-containing protein [Candidatus Woesearchaeota archaeon]|nr:DUF58 domain-containing protein [Candidatus Woesearchaeota archaeon]